MIISIYVKKRKYKKKNGGTQEGESSGLLPVLLPNRTLPPVPSQLCTNSVNMDSPEGPTSPTYHPECPSHLSCSQNAKLLRQWDPATVWLQQRSCAGYPADLCFLAGSFTYKTGRPICLHAGCRHKVRIPSFEHCEHPRSVVLHRERLTTNSKHDSFICVSEKEGNSRWRTGSLLK